MTAELPSLFGWGRGGVPGEISSYIAGVETTARMERGESYPHGRNASGFQAIGVAVLADRLLTDLRRERSDMQCAKGNAPKLRHELACWVFLLLAYCAERKGKAPASLLWLAFEAFDLSEGRPAPEFRKIGLLCGVRGIRNVEAFLSASALDGKADADGIKLSVMSLSESVGVERATVRRWRSMTEYQQRRKYCAWLEAEAGVAVAG